MALGYIGQVQIDNGDILPVGSNLFGICETPATTASKIIGTNQNLGQYFDELNNATVHIQFKYGNTVEPGNPNNLLTLKIGSTLARPIANPGGTCMWSANAVVSLTYDGTNWVCNDSTTASVPISDTYDSTSSTAISGKGVAAALGTLDGSITGSAAASKTLSALSQTDGVVNATFTDIQIGTSQVTGLGTAAERAVDTTIANNSTSTNLPTSAAVAAFLDRVTSGLTSAMHFKGVLQSLPEATSSTTFDNYESGDVVLINQKEYVYVKGDTAALSKWVELGDEGSYALKSNTDVITEVGVFTPNTLPTLTVTPTDIPNVTNAGSAASLTTNTYSVPNVTRAGTATTVSVTGGVLSISIGQDTTLDDTPFTIKGVDEFTPNTIPTLGTPISVGSASGWTAGGQASLTTNDTTVVVPGNT